MENAHFVKIIMKTLITYLINAERLGTSGITLIITFLLHTIHIFPLLIE